MMDNEKVRGYSITLLMSLPFYISQSLKLVYMTNYDRVNKRRHFLIFRKSISYKLWKVIAVDVPNRDL